MNISKFVIVVGASAGGMNALSEFVRLLKTGMGSAIFSVSMVAHSKGNIAGNRNKFTGVKVEWLYRLDEAGVVIPIEKINIPKSKSGLIF